jgi:hypothetical protein
VFKEDTDESLVCISFKNPKVSGSYCYWPEHRRMKCHGKGNLKEPRWFRGYFMREYWCAKNSSNDLAPWWVDRMKQRNRDRSGD